MVDEEQQLTIVEQFETNSIRKTWHQEEWWLCLPDVVAVFAGTKRASKYWYDLRRSIIEEEGYTELSARIGKLKFQLDNGRLYPMDAANVSTVSRILQSIRSPLAEPFKQWLASLATEEIQTIDDPELARERLRKAYERMNRPANWIKLRIDGIDIRKKLTNEWQIRGIVAGWEYAILTNRISEETFGITTKAHKELKGLRRQDLREHYAEIEHALINLSEAAAHEFTVQRDSQGFKRIEQDAIDGGRADLESQGLKVVTEHNYLEKPKKNHREHETRNLIEQPLQPSLFSETEAGLDEK